MPIINTNANDPIVVQVKGNKASVISSPTGSATRLTELVDVTGTPRANGDVLTYIAANAKFEFHAPTGGSGGTGNAFGTINVAGQNNIVANATSNTLVVVGGTGIVLTTDNVNNSLTITASGGTDQFARDQANGAFNKANGAIYTAAQIRANISNTSPINYNSSTGTISHALSGVTATGYGDSATIPKFVLDDKGHVVSVTNTTIGIGASQIITDILPVHHGGTGKDETGIVNGAILIGNTVNTGFDLTTLTQGTGIAITNGKGTITIASTGDQFARDQANGAFNKANGTAQNAFTTLTVTGPAQSNVVASSNVDTLNFVAGNSVLLRSNSTTKTIKVSVPTLVVEPTVANVAASTWTVKTTGVNNNWRSIAWSPELGLFAAGAETGANNRIMTSPDGVKWTTRATPNGLYRGISWSPDLGLFAAVSSSATVFGALTSPDGVTWTPQTTNTNQWRGIIWAKELGLFVAVSDTGSLNRVMTSPDGITWTPQTTTDAQWRGIAWSPELRLLVAVAAQGTGSDTVMTSPDGITWTVRTSPVENWTTVVWSSELGLFVAVGSVLTTSGVMTSPDGINWTQRTTNANFWQGVVWARELGLFVATAITGANNRVMISSDGVNWSTRPTNNNQWRALTWSPELGILCSVADSGSERSMISTPVSGWRTLLVSQGGTGQTAIGVNGSILISNTVSGGYDVNTITSGFGISVTNDKGSITIASTGDQFARDTANGAFAQANGAYANANTAIYTASQIRANISNTAPINYNSTTGVISHALSGVTATTYGNTSYVPSVTVDSAGHITGASNVLIAVAASQITSGTLAVSRGGTANGTAPANGAVPIGNTVSGGYDINTLTQGTGIVITNDKGSITIAATGGSAIDQYARDKANAAVANSGVTANGVLLIGNTVSGGFDERTLTQGTGIVITNDKGTVTIAATGGSSTDQFARDQANAAFNKANAATPNTATANGQIYVGNTVSGQFDLTTIAQTAPVIVTNGRGTVTLSHASSGVTATGYGTVNNIPVFVVDQFGHITSVTNTAIAITAAQITSGTLAVARGGTGQTAITVNGALLIANTVSSGFDVNPITQGAGVLITNDKGSITIAANVTSVAGRTGAITLNTNDVAENAAGPYYFTAARVRANITNTAPINYDSTTGTISHALSGVTATTYGNATFVPTVTVDNKGHVTSVVNTAIQLGTTAQVGLLMLEDSVTSISTTNAATTNVVNTAYTLAQSAYNRANAIQAVATSGGGVTVLYCNPTPNTVGADVHNFTLAISPSGNAEVRYTTTVAANTRLLARFISNNTIGLTFIDSGTWEFATYANTSSVTNAGKTSVVQRVNKRYLGTGTLTATGAGATRTLTITGGTPFFAGMANTDIVGAYMIETPTQNFFITAFTSSSVVTGSLDEPQDAYTNETGVVYYIYEPILTALETDDLLVADALYPSTSFTPRVTCNTTDTLVVAYFARTTKSSRSVSFVVAGTTHASHVHTPIAVRHNRLQGLDGGLAGVVGEFYHLTATEYSKLAPAYNQANTATVNADAAFAQANAAYTRANTANTVAASAYAQANIATTNADAAFAKANAATPNTATANGQIYAGNTVSGKFDLTSIAQSAPVIVTNGKGTITLSHASSGVTATGYGTAAQVPVFVVDQFGHITSVTNTAISLDAAAIATGTLVVARGGTGQSTYTNGQILIGNTGSTGLDKATIAQSAPVIVTVAQGSITLSHARSGVTATGYGDGATVPVFVVDANGHITSVTNTAIAITTAAVSEFAGGPFYFTSARVRANVTNTAPINYDPATGTFSHALSGATATGYGDAATIPVFVVNTTGHVTGVTNTAITISTTAITSGILSVARGGTGKDATGLVNGALLIGNTVNTGFDLTTIAQTAPVIVTNGKGTITLSHASSGVTATGYGTAAQVPVFVVDQYGHITSVTNTAIAITTAAVSEFAGGPFYFTAARVRGNVTNTAPINYDPATGTFSHALSGVTATGYGDAATVPKVVVDDKGHVTSVTNTAIAIAASQITSGTLVVARGGTGQTAASLVNGAVLIGNTVSGGYDLNTLSQGTGIVITNDKGSILIAATGGASTDQFARDTANGAFAQANAAYSNANTAIYTASQIRANISNTSPINYDPVTGIISHALSGVTATGYGDAATIPVFVVNQYGHLSSVVNTSISIGASQVTSGTLAVARGGTGQTATGIVNGALLIGNTVSSGYDIKTLTQGTNITITNDKGTITIAAAAGGLANAWAIVNTSTAYANTQGNLSAVGTDTLIFTADAGMNIKFSAVNGDQITFAVNPGYVQAIASGQALYAL